MARYRSYRIASVAVCAIVGLLASATAALAQIDFRQTEAQAAALKASPELVNGLANEISSTPEQAASAAGVLFSLAKSLLKPEDFAAISKAVPGMDALLAATPEGAVVTPSALALTPGFASSSPSATGATTVVPEASALAGLSKLGIKPEMIAKALPYLSGYLKKYGGAAVASLLGGLFKGGKPGQ